MNLLQIKFIRQLNIGILLNSLPCQMTAGVRIVFRVPIDRVSTCVRFLCKILINFTYTSIHSYGFVRTKSRSLYFYPHFKRLNMSIEHECLRRATPFRIIISFFSSHRFLSMHQFIFFYHDFEKTTESTNAQAHGHSELSLCWRFLPVPTIHDITLSCSSSDILSTAHRRIFVRLFSFAFDYFSFFNSFAAHRIRIKCTDFIIAFGVRSRTKQCGQKK